MTSKTNEKGLSNIFSGLGINNEASILELIDNSIDAKARNINIKISNKSIQVPIKGKNIIIAAPLLIIEDDGIGMGLDEQNSRFEKLMNIMTKNTKNNVNGLFGLGAISSNHQICKKRIDPKTIIISKTAENDIALETIIDWEIFNKKGWSNNFQVISSSSNLFNKNNGTIIINTIDKDYNQLVEKLKYKLMFHYFYYLKDEKITINYDDQIKNINWILNKSSNIYNFDGSQNSINKKFIFKVYYNENCINFKPYNYTNLSIKNGYLNLSPINKDKNMYPTFFTHKSQPSKLKYEKMKLTIVVINPKDFESQELKLLRQDLDFSYNTTDYTGFYIKRNDKILAKPFSSEYVRNSQTGNYFRYILEYENNNSAIDVRINKSEINETSINKLLFRGVSILVKKFYNTFVKHAKFCKENFDNNKICIELLKKNSKSTSNKKKKKKKKKYIISDSESESNSESESVTDSDKKKKRKAFSIETKRIINQQSKFKCAITDIKLENGIIDYDYDHIDNDSSNNLVTNCQILSLQAHRNKTNNKYENANIGDKKITEELLKQLNCILDSKFIKEKIESGNIKFSKFNNNFLLNNEIYKDI